MMLCEVREQSVIEMKNGNRSHVTLTGMLKLLTRHNNNKDLILNRTRNSTGAVETAIYRRHEKGQS